MRNNIILTILAKFIGQQKNLKLIRSAELQNLFEEGRSYS